MESKYASTWLIAKDLCRCCHAEGDFFNLATPNTFKDREEIYSDMLRTCFDIEIDPVPGRLCIPTYSICSKCVVKLREAVIFKEQVLKCEKKFYELLTSSSIAGLTQIKKEPEMDSEVSAQIKKEPEMYSEVSAQIKKEPEMYSEVLTQIKKEPETDSEDYNDDMDDDLDDEMDDYIDNDIDNDTDLKIEPGEQIGIEEHLKRPLRSRIQKTTEVTEIKAAQESKPKPKPKPKKPPKEKKVKKEEKKVKKEKKKEDNTERKELEEQYCSTRLEEDGSQTYTCKICSNTYKRKDSIKQHYRHVHLKQRPRLHGCYYCPEKVRAYLRAQHMEEVHGIPAPTCGACGKKFAFPFQVVKHQKTFHMGERNFVCPVCNMSFGTKPNLRQHVIKHTTERPFKCDFCDEAFKWKKHLRRHMAGHLHKKR
ncbi:zinc finger protein 652-like isoform X6 [Pieris brassicae]|uniref:zinc finger protein 652-like isoform X6 n=1 Tax=Pieris brassicae TaxID=7116 RepID=UPI001E6607FE|nr:zinc finger protein 652-like isoform X6 [Pieris brassicae]